MEQGRRLPREMMVKRKRVPVSARLLEETAAVLAVHAKKNKMSLAELVSHILDDYVIWLVKTLKTEAEPGGKRKAFKPDEPPK